MTRWFISLGSVLLAIVLGLSVALAAAVEEDLQRLKDKDPEVRAAAAVDLSCG
jgi:HEAT repeat protein